jgi:chloride channel protein, CIC family
LILWFTVAFSGHQDYSGLGHAAHPVVPFLGPWFVVLAPALGGLVYGPLVDRFAREARGHGVPEVMLAVAEHGGRIRPRVAIVKSLASALCIGSGGSVGREGPIVQIGSALGSALGQVLRVPSSRLRLLVACGAAGGISATFNAPIAGVVFALELILRNIEAESFGVVVLASVMANVVGRAAFGAAPFLALPPFQMASRWEYFLYAGLGLGSALVGVAFIRVLYGTEDLFDRLWKGPEWLRPAAGGLLLGLILLALPELYGVGYPILERAIKSEYAVPFLLLLLGGKLVATSVTIGMGGSGGVFAPSLFLGAMLGAAYGSLVHSWWPGLTGPAGAYGLVAMGAVFAGAARAPMTSVIIIFELTGEYEIILPLMLAVALAAGISNLLSRDTIYTLKLRRRGIDLTHSQAPSPLHGARVRDAMRPLPPAVGSDQPMREVVARFARQDLDSVPVVDGAHKYRGVVQLREIEQRLADEGLNSTAGDLAIELPGLRVDARLESAIPALARARTGGLPVVDDGEAVVGWLTERDVLNTYSDRLQFRASPE